MKKFSLYLLVTLLFCAPVFAYKDLSAVKWGEPQKVEVLDFNQALEIRIDYIRMRAPVYVSNLDCHEFSRTYTLKSTNGKTYVRPRQRTVRVNSAASDYLNDIFKKNAGNIYFSPNGYGLYGNLVGEFYIGNQSLSQHLIDKGYCTYIK